MKIVLNKCYGGFGLTKLVFDELGLDWDGYGYPENKSFGIESDNYLAYRAHKPLIEAIEKVGIEASTSSMAELVIIDVPDDVIDWYIGEYDGMETIHETHRSW